MSKPVGEPIAVDDHIQRECKTCKISKQLNTEFSFHSATDYYDRRCKDCCNELRRIKHAKLPIPEKFLEKPPKQKIIFQNKPYRKTTIANRKRLNYKCYDKKRGWECDLTTEFVEKALDSDCFYCGDKPTGLDRILNTKGHTMDNCVPCCYECNTTKMDNFSTPEMALLGKTIKNIKMSRKEKEEDWVEVLSDRYYSTSTTTSTTI